MMVQRGEALTENQAASGGDGSDSLWRKSGTHKLWQLLWHEASVTTVQSGWLCDTPLSPPHRFDETNRLGFFLPVGLTSAVQKKIIKKKIKKILWTNRWVRRKGGRLKVWWSPPFKKVRCESTLHMREQNMGRERFAEAVYTQREGDEEAFRPVGHRGLACGKLLKKTAW